MNTQGNNPIQREKKEPIFFYKKVMNFGKDIHGKKQKAISIPIELRDLIEKDKVYKITIEEL